MSGRSHKVMLDVLGYAAVLGIATLAMFVLQKPIDHAWTILVGRI